MLQTISFKGMVKKFPGLGGWFYVKVPDDLLPENVPTEKWGFTKVLAVLGQTKWETSLMPMKDGGKFIALRASVRKKEQVQMGDGVSIQIFIKD